MSTPEKKKNFIRRMYDWTVSWADKPQSTVALSILSAAESSFFPVPPDVLLIPLVYGKPKKWWYFALVCTVFSVIGGVIGWYIGYAGWEAVKDFFFNYVPGFTPENFDYVKNLYKDNALLAIFTAAFTPIPYKIFTITAGVCDVPLYDLILGSIVGRGGRFFLVGLIIRVVGPKSKEFIDKYFNLLTIAFFVLLVLGFLAVKYCM